MTEKITTNKIDCRTSDLAELTTNISSHLFEIYHCHLVQFSDHMSSKSIRCILQLINISVEFRVASKSRH